MGEELTNEIKAGIGYLQSQLKDGASMTMHLRGSIAQVVYSSTSDVEKYTELFEIKPLSNPIGKAIANIFEHVCTDCMREDYNFKDPYFTSLIKSYFECLTITYGELVPITKTMARAILRHKLSTHQVVYSSIGQDKHLAIDNADHPIFDHDRSFYLKVKTC